MSRHIYDKNQEKTDNSIFKIQQPDGSRTPNLKKRTKYFQY